MSNSGNKNNKNNNDTKEVEEEGSSLAVLLAPPPLLAGHVMLKILTAPTFCVNHDLHGESVSV